MKRVFNMDVLKCPYCGYEKTIPRSEDDIRELDFHAFLSCYG